MLDFYPVKDYLSICTSADRSIQSTPLLCGIIRFVIISKKGHIYEKSHLSSLQDQQAAQGQAVHQALWHGKIQGKCALPP